MTVWYSSPETLRVCRNLVTDRAKKFVRQQRAVLVSGVEEVEVQAQKNEPTEE